MRSPWPSLGHLVTSGLLVRAHPTTEVERSPRLYNVFQDFGTSDSQYVRRAVWDSAFTEVVYRPNVSLPYATLIGSSRGSVEIFKNIPYAVPPINDLRLRPSTRLDPNNHLGQIGPRNKTFICPQFSKFDVPRNPLKALLTQTVVAGQMLSNAVQGLPESENCLTLDVYRPSTIIASTTNTPVVIWIYGGGFEFGSKEDNDATAFVKHSIELEKPVIFVTMNYRTGGFGFLAGKEILQDGSSNLGLRDQRLAIEWVSDHIHLFGGDKSKVTLWGESAGSISVLNHMIWNHTSKYNSKSSQLFRGVIMNSGSIVPADRVDCRKSQRVYDDVVKYAGCAETKDSLLCLRQLPYANYKRAVDSVSSVFSYESLMLSYLPRPDDNVILQSPEQLIREGRFTRVPLIIGNQEDEGSVFSLTQNSITTKTDVETYLSTVYFHNAPLSLVQDFVSLYDENVTAPSKLNNLYPQYRRLAAILGDMTFTLTRRLSLALISSSRDPPKSWNYVATYGSGNRFLGTYHSSDLAKSFGTDKKDLATRAQQIYFISFVYDLNPNSAVNSTLIEWPQWTDLGRKTMNFSATEVNLSIDNYREPAYQFLKNNSDLYFKI